MFNSFYFGNICSNKTKTINDRSDYIMITTFALLGGAFAIAAGLNFFAVNENAFIDDEATN